MALLHVNTSAKGRKLCRLRMSVGNVSGVFRPFAVARALVRAASALMPTPGDDRLSVPHQGAEKSLDTARTSAFATARARCEKCTLGGLSGFRGGEVGAIRMVEHQRADAGFGLHHHALGEPHASLFRAQQLEKPLLIVQVG